MDVMTTSSSMAEQVSAQPEFGPQMPLSEKLLAIAIRAQNFTGASGVAVAIKEGQEVVCRASWGTSAPDVGVRLQDQNSFTYQCMRAGKPMRCDDGYADPRVDNAACQALGIRAIAAAPVGTGNDVLGVIAAFSEEANAFTETHMVVLTTLGEVVCKFLKDAEPSVGANITGASAKKDDLLAIEDDLPEVAPLHGAELPKSEPVKLPASSLQMPKPPGEPAKPTAAKPTPQAPANGKAPAKIPFTAAPAAPAKPGVELEREPEIRPDTMVSSSEIRRDPSLVNSDAPVPPVPVSAKPGSKLSSLGDKRPAWLGMIDHAAKAKPAVEPLASEPAPPPLVASDAPKIPVMSPSNTGTMDTPATDGLSLTFTEPAEPVLVDKRKYLMLGGAAAALVLVLALWTWHSHRASKVVAQAPPTPVQQQVADNDPSFQAPPVEQTEAAAAPARTVTEKPSSQKPSAKKTEEPDATAEDTVKIVNTPIRKPAAAPQPAPEPEAPPMVTVSSASLPADLLAVKTALPSGPSPQTSHFVPSEVVQKVTPVYPEMAKRYHMQGRVILNARIDASGKVQEVKFIGGPPAFQQAAVEAVRRWKYKPAYLNGKPVESNAEITLNFASQ